MIHAVVVRSILFALVEGRIEKREVEFGNFRVGIGQEASAVIMIHIWFEAIAHAVNQDAFVLHMTF